ncbi:hypothetical protein HPB50_002685 [Hyalomma asiaticum]|uniref:Uncharacterized protein n=1 Tax=Hyalomma asiaticum TaxID=266040 RepID=A0ACB7T9Z2_HYAAI|nr:hypothetical protein HPB50_002685 [Hyalomma asiaticum]
MSRKRHTDWEAFQSELEKSCDSILSPQEIEEQIVASASSRRYEAHLVRYQALQAEHPSLTDLQVILGDLQDEDSALVARDEKTAGIIGAVTITGRKPPSSARPGDSAHRVLASIQASSPNTAMTSRVAGRLLGAFRVTIHNNHELSDIEKLKYLPSYLTGPGKRAFEGVRLEEANYTVVKVLQERYGRRTALVEEHIDSLLAIAPADRSSRSSQLLEQ